MPSFIRALAMAATSLLALPAAHALPELSAEFRDPVGTVGVSDDIEVWITLRSVGDTAFTFDQSLGETPFGLDPALLPLTGNDYAGQQYGVSFGSYTSISVFTFRYCNDSFSNVCDPGAYDTTVPSGSASSWFNVQSPFSLAPGDTMDVHVYTYTPVGGSAAPGTYSAYNLGVGLSVRGLAEDGVTVLEGTVFEATTCNGLPAEACSFTRTVTAVPEPTTTALMLGGLLSVAAWTGRRRRIAHA